MSDDLPAHPDLEALQAKLDPSLIRKVWQQHARMLQRAPTVLRKLTQDAASTDLPTRREARKIFLPYVQDFVDEYRKAVQEGDTSELLGLQDVEFIRVLKYFSDLYRRYGNEFLELIHDKVEELEDHEALGP